MRKLCKLGWHKWAVGTDVTDQWVVTAWKCVHCPKMEIVRQTRTL